MKNSNRVESFSRKQQRAHCLFWELWFWQECQTSWQLLKDQWDAATRVQVHVKEPVMVLAEQVASQHATQDATLTYVNIIMCLCSEIHIVYLTALI